MDVIRNPHREKYTVVGRPLVNDKCLSFRARGVLIWLLDKPDGWRFDSAQLATEGTEGREAIRTALNELRALRYVHRRKRQDEKGHWLTETLIFEVPTDPPTDQSMQVLRPSTDAQESVVGQPDVGAPGAIERTEPNTEKEVTPLPPTGGVCDGPWRVFWAVYPRKTGKVAAERAYRTALKTRSAGEIAQALDCWVRYWRDEHTEEKFIPHAGTWLNQRRFDEDPPPLSRRKSVADERDGFFNKLREMKAEGAR